VSDPLEEFPPGSRTAATASQAPADLDEAGIAVRLPPGWEGVIYRRDPGEVELPDDLPPERRRQPTSRSVVHLGSFPLPPGRGDYGSGAVEIMRDADVLIILFEFEPESASTAQFARSGLPRNLDPDDFDPNQMQRPLAGMAGCQRFFNVGGTRAFCLFAVIGSYADRAVLVPKVNAVLAGIEIS
jgi:hypothetical protein